MSNIYIQEPLTSGKVLLKTSVGDIDIELWTKECPKACRNFIQLCMEGYYNGTIFHRLVKGFIVQGGDPNGDGSGGESIYGAPFKDEFHSRLRYARRGLVGMANADKDDNGSQFFFTFAETPELQNKNTLFGKVAGDTIYNMLKLEEGLVDHNERPLYPQRIIGAEVLSNPFDDIKPRILQKPEKKEKRKKREKGVKNFGLLSFGEEAEDDEQETNVFVQKNAGKAKSLHDVIDDPKLSKEAVKIKSKHHDHDDNDDDEDEEQTRLSDDALLENSKDINDVNEQRERIRDKLKMKKSNDVAQRKKNSPKDVIESDSEEDVLMTKEQSEKLQSEKKRDEIRQQINSLKKQYQTDKRVKDEVFEKKQDNKTPDAKLNEEAKKNEFIQNFIEDKIQYKNLQSNMPKKGASREDFTLQLLSKFRNKLSAIKQKQNDDEDENIENDDVDEETVEKDIHSDDWLAHTLRFESKAPVLAKDASTKNDDWYDAYDPRNPLNKRKRGLNTKGCSGSTTTSTAKRSNR